MRSLPSRSPRARTGTESKTGGLRRSRPCPKNAEKRLVRPSLHEGRGRLALRKVMEQGAPENGAPVLVNIILAVYDRDGALVTMSTMEADLSDINYVFSNTLDIPEGVSVGSIRMMIWNGLSDMTPISAASSIL